MKRFLTAGLLLLGACRPVHQGDGEVKSLDNYTRQDGVEVSLNHCGMDLESPAAAPAKVKGRAPAILAANDALKLAVMSSLTAVPEGLAGPFFAAGGTIEVSPNAEDLCRNLPLSAAERRFAGEAKRTVRTCWRQHGSGKPPVIYVAADAKTIRHGLVRAFAFLYGELFVARLDAMLKSQKGFGQGAVQVAAAYRQNTAAVGDALISDMAKTKPAVAPRLKQYKQDDAEAYARVATAEALDSYYCSPATQFAFKKSFGGTWRAFVGSAKNGLAASFGTPWFQ